MADVLSLGLQLLNAYIGVCRWQTTAAGSLSLEAALPAAPAAVHLTLTTFQTYSRLQQLADRARATRALLHQHAAYWEIQHISTNAQRTWV
jgi:hypothetical protein